MEPRKEKRRRKRMTGDRTEGAGPSGKIPSLDLNTVHHPS